MMKAVRGLLAVALFPLVVTAVVSCGFLVGCPVPKSAGVALAMATVATATVAWWRGGWRGLALALGWLVLTFFIADQFVFGQLGDYFHYHYPQALLLGEGWNPVFASSMTEASAAMGVPLDTLRPVHTFCFPLALAQFCAAVAWLTGSLCGFLWEPFLFLPAVCWLAWVTLRAVIDRRLRDATGLARTTENGNVEPLGCAWVHVPLVSPLSDQLGGLRWAAFPFAYLLVRVDGLGCDNRPRYESRRQSPQSMAIRGGASPCGWTCHSCLPSLSFGTIALVVNTNGRFVTLGLRLPKQNLWLHPLRSGPSLGWAFRLPSALGKRLSLGTADCLYPLPALGAHRGHPLVHASPKES